MKKKNTIIIAALIFCLMLGVLTGCSLKKQEQSAANEDSVSEQTQLTSVQEENAVNITLNGSSATADSNSVTIEKGNILITDGGTYSLNGELTDGRITVDAGDETVELILNGVNITSADSSAINIVNAGSAVINVKEGTENTISDSSEYDLNIEYSDKEKEEPDACVFSKSDLTVTGSGKLTVSGNYKNGIKSKDTLTVENADLIIDCVNNALTGSDAVKVSGSTLDITSKGDGIHSNGDVVIESGTVKINSDDDGIHADSSVTVNAGAIEITAHEGIEGTVVTVNDGKITINASDDGINAAQKVDGITPTVEINGGEITITMGAGDTDAIDSNGNIAINGGKISITGQSAFDYDGKAEFNGGEIYVNGEQISEITNQFAGGQGGGFGKRMQPGNMPPDENGGFGGRPPRDFQSDGFAPAFPENE